MDLSIWGGITKMRETLDRSREHHIWILARAKVFIHRLHCDPAARIPFIDPYLDSSNISTDVGFNLLFFYCT